AETIKTLPDGNRIVQRFEGRIYRDNQGRPRNERTFLMGGASDQKQTITIFDPDTAISYILDPETRIARKSNSYVIAAPPSSRPAVVFPSPPAKMGAPTKRSGSG